MSFALDLAQRANAIRFDRVSGKAVHIARRAIVDTIGVALAGSSADYIDGLARVLDADGQRGPASCIGRAGAFSVLHAALINGTAAHALDFDDCSTVMLGHPSAPVVPAILALAQQRKADGRAIIEAYLTGVEVETRLARGVMPHHYDKGWHPTATLGVFGAAAASARILGFDDELFANTLAVAVSMASGIKSNFGSPVKPMHVGQAAHNGVLAALTVAKGMTANHDAFDHNYGFFNVFNGSGNFAPEKVLEGWGDTLEVLEPGIVVKQHPCCGSAHSAIDAALSIRATHGPLDAGSVSKIETWTHERRLAHTNRSVPRTGLDARFSVQFLTAKAIAAGCLRLSDFEDAGFMTADVETLLPLVVSQAHREEDQYLGRVRVTLKNGGVLEGTASTALGRGPGNPMSDAELAAKFVDCARTRHDEETANDLFAEIMNIDQVKDVSGIMYRIAG
jgi:2-methylcitrate dehydratase PrpD